MVFILLVWLFDVDDAACGRKVRLCDPINASTKINISIEYVPNVRVSVGSWLIRREICLIYERAILSKSISDQWPDTRFQLSLLRIINAERSELKFVLI